MNFINVKIGGDFRVGKNKEIFRRNSGTENMPLVWWWEFVVLDLIKGIFGFSFLR